ncbi:hypothetical protein, partial [Pseudomonas sp. KCJK9000]
MVSSTDVSARNRPSDAGRCGGLNQKIVPKQDACKGQFLVFIKIFRLFFGMQRCEFLIRIGANTQIPGIKNSALWPD